MTKNLCFILEITCQDNLFSILDLNWEFAHFFVDPFLISSPKIENEFVQSQVYSLTCKQMLLMIALNFEQLTSCRSSQTPFLFSQLSRRIFQPKNQRNFNTRVVSHNLPEIQTNSTQKTFFQKFKSDHQCYLLFVS